MARMLHWTLGTLTKEERDGVEVFRKHPYLDFVEISNMIGALQDLNTARTPEEAERGKSIVRELLKGRHIKCAYCRKAGKYEDGWCSECREEIPDWKERQNDPMWFPTHKR